MKQTQRVIIDSVVIETTHHIDARTETLMFLDTQIIPPDDFNGKKLNAWFRKNGDKIFHFLTFLTPLYDEKENDNKNS